MKLQSATEDYANNLVDITQASEVVKATELNSYAQTDFKAGAKYIISLLSNEVYAAIIKECEYLEQQKIYKGNGHHLAQRLTEMITNKFEL